MTEEVTQQTFQETVRDKMRETFMDMMPAEVFGGLVKTTIKDYFGLQDDLETPARLPKETPFAKEVHAVLREEVRAITKKQIESMGESYWSTKGRQELNPAIKEMIVAAAPQMFADMISGAVQITLQNVQNNVY